MNFPIVLAAVVLYAASVADVCLGHDTDDLVLPEDLEPYAGVHVDL
jgi:hypothetical protein